jgi:prolyl oligopeptidase
VAYGTAEGGSELTTIHIQDVTTGATLPDALPYAGGGTSPQALVWDSDESGVTYARYPAPQPGSAVQLFDVALYHHPLGAAAAADRAVFGVGYSAIAEYRLLASADGTSAAALVNKGDGGYAEVYLRSGGDWRRVLDESYAITTASFVGNRLFAIATAGSQRGRIVAVAADGSVADVLGEGEWAIGSLAPILDGFLAVRVLGTRWRVDHYDSLGNLVRTVPLPAEGVGIGGIASSASSADALIEYSGWSLPRRWAKYSATSGEISAIFEVEPAADYSRIEARAIEATSQDGTKVPVFVISLAGTPLDGSAPALLNGYGGFGLSSAPSFVGPYLAWLERGGILAYAILRGGSEFGEAWHQQGKGRNKQNVFDDFYAAAQALVAQRYTSPGKLGAMGRSNGGLLMGAQITQHPEAFRAVVSFVGIYDMLGHEDFPNGKYNVTEYGSKASERDFRALYGYSPYHHVRQGVAYPAVLMETGVNDPRVAPWQSRKFAAALQAATTSARPILLLTRTGAGHGIGAPFSQRVGNTALALTFFVHELAPPAR